MADKKGGMMSYMKYSVIGIEMAGSVIVGGFIGYWLDYYLGTDPWMFIIWVICGLIAGFRSLYRISKQYLSENKENEDQRSD
jgi:ATP synthase protein I